MQTRSATLAELKEWTRRRVREITAQESALVVRFKEGALSHAALKLELAKLSSAKSSVRQMYQYAEAGELI